MNSEHYINWESRDNQQLYGFTNTKNKLAYQMEETKKEKEEPL